MSIDELKAPFPWFGGKSRAAPIIWARFGRNVHNYVEPFFGSGAVLLSRGRSGRTETINDKDGYVSNFWRAVKHDPNAVAQHADWPVSERDLEARHYWLVTDGARRLDSVLADPDGYDAKIAGWWVWGLCSWIGTGWCSGVGPWQATGTGWTKGSAGRGINRQMPHVSDAGRGINRQGAAILEAMTALSARLRGVRVCSGDWSRVCGPSVTTKLGTTAVFMDPPYSAEAGRTKNIYAVDCLSVAHEARQWAIANGSNPHMRICLAGYEGEHEMPDDWEVVAWKAKGGYGSQSENSEARENAKRERLWFSPHCLRVPECLSVKRPNAEAMRLWYGTACQ